MQEDPGANQTLETASQQDMGKGTRWWEESLHKDLHPGPSTSCSNKRQVHTKSWKSWDTTYLLKLLENKKISLIFNASDLTASIEHQDTIHEVWDTTSTTNQATST